MKGHTQVRTWGENVDRTGSWDGAAGGWEGARGLIDMHQNMLKQAELF